MKRTVVVLTLVFAGTVCIQGNSQQPAAAEVLRHTKIGVVNLGLVYTEYESVKRFKAALERQVAPLAEKKAALEESIAEWKAIARSRNENYSPQTREMARTIVLESSRQLEDLGDQAKDDVAGKLDNFLMKLNYDLQKAIDVYAAEHGYHLILALGEPKAPLSALQAFTRKMAVVDKGGLTLLHASGDVDVSLDVLKSLNKKAE